MMTLCTGQPSVRCEREHIIATIPSGSGEVEIALSYGQATLLGECMAREAREAICSRNVAASAEVVAFKRPRGNRRRPWGRKGDIGANA
jgi:hypothetical protein